MNVNSCVNILAKHKGESEGLFIPYRNISKYIATHLKSRLHGYKRGFPRPKTVTSTYNLKVTLSTKTKREGCNHVTTKNDRWPYNEHLF